jgi:hypothetical protein
MEIQKILDEVDAERAPYLSWEMLPGESSAAYAAFSAFRDYGPERKIGAAAEQYTGGAENFAKRYRMWRQWSAKFDWTGRAKKYDVYFDQLKVTERRELIEALRDKRIQAAATMIDTADKKMQSMAPEDLNQALIVSFVEAGGRVVQEELDFENGNGGTDSGTEKQGQIVFASDFKEL